LTGTTSKWAGGVLAPNGKIYGIPFKIAVVLIIDPVLGTADTSLTGSGLLTGNFKWNGGVLSSNGQIYAIPRASTTVLIIDPAVPSVNTASITGLVSPSWAGGILAPNGTIYGVPYVNNNVLQIEPGLPSLPPWMLEAYFNKF
jgi:hypothetical protein